MQGMDSHDLAACVGRCPPHGWLHWPGQSCIHPATVVLPELDPVPGYEAWQWAMVPLTLCGEAWWHGYAAIEHGDEVVAAWVLVPRDPVADPGWFDDEARDAR